MNFTATDIAISGATISNFSGSDSVYTFDITLSASGLNMPVNWNDDDACSINNADIRFKKLRRELPFTIFALFCMGESVALNSNFPDIEKILQERPENNHNYSLRSSRNSFWGISVKRN